MRSFSQSPFAEHPALAHLPSTFIWAWERPEDVRWLPADVGVAYVASSILLEGDTAYLRLRRHPLRINPAQPRMAVVHVDASTRMPPQLNARQQQLIVEQVMEAASRGNVAAVQLDFEARRSQRAFLRTVVADIRAKLPETVALSITALASWCEGDRWLNDIRADEIVPMAFRMASGDHTIRARLAAQGRFDEPRCANALGLATDEWPVNVVGHVRRYIFSPTCLAGRKFAAISGDTCPRTSRVTGKCLGYIV